MKTAAIGLAIVLGMFLLLSGCACKEEAKRQQAYQQEAFEFGYALGKAANFNPDVVVSAPLPAKHPAKAKCGYNGPVMGGGDDHMPSGEPPRQ